VLNTAADPVTTFIVSVVAVLPRPSSCLVVVSFAVVVSFIIVGLLEVVVGRTVALADGAAVSATEDGAAVSAGATVSLAVVRAAVGGSVETAAAVGGSVETAAAVGGSVETAAACHWQFAGANPTLWLSWSNTTSWWRMKLAPNTPPECSSKYTRGTNLVALLRSM
jgi:hypothetical protein